jgi:hypothetical protein
MFLEELLRPLKEKSKKNNSDIKERIINKIIILLSYIERKPLKFIEKKIILNQINTVFKEYNLHDEVRLRAVIDRRFSIDFLPGVHTLAINISKHSSKLIKTNNMNNNMIMGINNSSNNGSSSSKDDYRMNINENNSTQQQQQQINQKLSIERSINNNLLLKPTSSSTTTPNMINYYYLCSIRKHQSTLSTSYRLFIDGIKEININTKELSNTTIYSKPIMILGAKKFKTRASITLSSSTTTCYIWKDNDSKLWKEKNAIGKLIKYSSAKYTGVLLPLSSSYLKHYNSSSNNTTATTTTTSYDHNGSMEDSIVISVRTPGLDKLIHIHSVAIKSSYDYRAFASSITNTTSATNNNSTTTTPSITINSPTENDNIENNTTNTEKSIPSSSSSTSNNQETMIMNTLDGLLEASLNNKFNIKIDHKPNVLTLIHTRSKQPRHKTDSNGK